MTQRRTEAHAGPSAAESLLNIICMEEHAVVGHFPLSVPGRVKLTASAFWLRFRAADDGHRPNARPSRDGGYAHCPRCRGKLAIEGALQEKGKRPLRGALIPIILGTTIVEVQA